MGEGVVSTCRFCDGGCRVVGEAGDDGRLRVAPASPEFPAICPKAAAVDEYRLHPDRLTVPLRRVGERGAGEWERVSWDEALDEIAAKLRAVIDEHGPEALAVAEMPLNIGFGGVTRRLMNALGAVNYTAPTQLCMGNTAQVHRAVYGWFASPDWARADCIVYFGQDRDMQRWPAEYLQLKAALARGATLIEVDPRLTDTARLADYHLRVRYGTDAALALAWINVIIEEGLYDAGFVAAWCVGFDELRERVAAWTPERAAEVCGVDAELIRQTARVYANAACAVIPWGVVADMQVNSTSLLQAQCILRAICGYLNDGENVSGPALGGVVNAQLAAFEMLAPEQRAKQLGQDGPRAHPLLTMCAAALYRDATARAGIPYEPDILGESQACDPSALFAAMRGEGPYPVRAFFAVGNNTVMSYAGQQGIVDAIRAQDLVVVFENWLTPTAQLADYVLPGDMWAERDVLGPEFDVAPVLTASYALREPPGECRGWDELAKGLADRLGVGDALPWADARELFDWRLAPIGKTFDDLRDGRPVLAEAPARGCFLTPSGKVELASSALATLGHDPLPSYVEPCDPAAAAEPGRYPYVAFAGLRERASYNTNFHQMPTFRAQAPEPLLLINPADAAAEGVADGAWCVVESAYGRVELVARLDDAQPAGSVRVPHGWWKPELPGGLVGGLSAACLHNDGMLMPDAEWNLDPVQGVPGLRGTVRVAVRPR